LGMILALLVSALGYTAYTDHNQVKALVTIELQRQANAAKTP